LKAIVYAAKSTKDPRGSIPTQLEDGRAMAASQGWKVVGEYTDEAESGWLADRGAQLAAAMAHAEQIAPCTLVVQHSDRLARGDGVQARHLVELLWWGKAHGVELRSKEDDSTFTNPLLTFAMGERNAEDSRRKSAAVKAGMQRAIVRGQHAGGPRPYGLDYQRDEDGKIIPRRPFLVVAHEAAIVRRIYDEAEAGWSQKATLRGLNADGIRTQRGRQWSQSTIAAILSSPLYKGCVHINGEEFPAKHEPIVSTAQWDRVAEIRKVAARSRGKGRGRRPKGSHLFIKGHLRCECGEAMTAVTKPNRSGGTYEVYTCYGRIRHGPDHCPQRPMKREVVDGAVFAYFAQVGLDVEATRQSIAEARDRKLAEIRALHEQAELEARRAEERLARVRRDYTDGKIDAEDWRDFRVELGGERQAARAQADRFEAQLREVERWGELKDAESETLHRVAEIRSAITGQVRDAQGLDAVRAALMRTFDHFVVRRRMPRVHVELIADVDLVIEPIVREHAIAGYSKNLRPILRRQSLTAGDGAKSEPPIFAPIEITASS
jgi:site-specific DNA recombinase